MKRHIRHTALAGSSLIILIAGCRAHHVSDETLKGLFVAERPAFEELLSMAKSDRNLRTINPHWILGAGKTIDPRHAGVAEMRQMGLSMQRWQRYQELFGRLGLTGGIYQGDDEVWFCVEKSSIGNGGVIKGFVYSEHPLQPRVNGSLDEYVTSKQELDQRGDYIAYKHLTGSWYLVYASGG